MNLQEEKIELVRLVLDMDDENLVREIKALLEGHYKSKEKSPDVSVFYDGFRESVREVKQSQDGQNQLKDAKEWLDGL